MGEAASDADGTRSVKRGRKTKAVEAFDYLTSVGISEEIVEQLKTAAENGGIPSDAAGLRKLLYARLAAEIPHMKNTALTQAHRAIEALEQAEKRGDGIDTEAEPLVADVIGGITSLPPDRKREILALEQDRLERELAAIAAWEEQDASVRA